MNQVVLSRAFLFASTGYRPDLSRSLQIAHIENSLIYVSRKRIALSANDAAISDIVAISRARNATLGVTGVLVSTSEHFAQILEGTAEAIDALMDSIHRDPRHDHVTVLRVRPIARRSFPGWSMAYSGASNYLARRIAPLVSAEISEEDSRIDRLTSFMAGLVR